MDDNALYPYCTHCCHNHPCPMAETNMHGHRSVVHSHEPEPEPATQGGDVCPIHPCGETVRCGFMLEHIHYRHPYVINPEYLYWGKNHESCLIFMENDRVIGTLTTERLPRKSRGHDRFMRAQWTSKLDTRLRVYGGGSAANEATTLEPSAKPLVLICFGSYQRRAALSVVYS